MTPEKDAENYRLETLRHNAEFEVTWNQTNLRWLLGDSPVDPDKVARCEAFIATSQKRADTYKAELIKHRGY